MKKYLSYIIAAVMVLGAFTSCEEKEKKYPKYPEIMQMTTSKSGEVTIYLAGEEPATIDWGDGSAKVTKELPPYYPFARFSHQYTGTNERTIKISGNNVTYLESRFNELMSLDVSKNTALIYLLCNFNQKISHLDISKNTALFELRCDDNRLSYLDVSQNTALSDLSCGSNMLFSLDVSNNTVLTSLGCSNNPLKDLDVSNNTILTSLRCSNNQLKDLDVSNNTRLRDLYCQVNQLSDLDLSANTVLALLLCNSNRLTSLDLSVNSALETVYCQNNRLQADALDVLFGSLHNKTIFGTLPGGGGTHPIPKTINVANNPGTDSCTPGIAEENGWMVIVKTD